MIRTNTTRRNPDSFYQAFTMSYIKQLSRFKRISQAAYTRNHFQNEIQNNRDYLGRIDLYSPNLKAYLYQNIEWIAEEIQFVTEKYFRDNDKNHLIYRTGTRDRVKITITNNDDFFLNVCRCFQVNILIYSSRYDPYNIIYNKAGIIVYVGYDDDFFSVTHKEEEAIDSNEGDKGAVLKLPYYYDESTQKQRKFNQMGFSQEIISRSPQTTILGPNIPQPAIRIREEEVESNGNIEDIINSLIQVILENIQFVPEDLKANFLEQIKFDSRFYMLRNRIQDIVTCDHEGYQYITLNCERQHCKQCIIHICTSFISDDKKKCSCGYKISREDIKALGLPVESTGVIGKK
jgi:hypothetical protein